MHLCKQCKHSHMNQYKQMDTHEPSSKHSSASANKPYVIQQDGADHPAIAQPVQALTHAHVHAHVHMHLYWMLARA